MDKTIESLQRKYHHLMNIQFPLSLTLEDMEKSLVIKRLQHYNGNKTHAAQSLGISLRSLYNKLDIYEGKVTTDAEINCLHPDAGLPVEPASVSSEKPVVPMYEREEIQKLPLADATGGNQKRGNGKRA